MTDKYIDHDEIQYYGPWAAKRIRDRVKGLIPEFDQGLEYVAVELEHATLSMVSLIETARGASLMVHKSVSTKTPAVEQSLALLSRFSAHLDTHVKGALQRKAFFTTDGTVSGIGHSAARVVLALSQISLELKKADCAVRESGYWQKLIDDQTQLLTPIAAHAHDALADKQSSTTEVEAARQAWLHVYKGARKMVDGVLTLAGRRSILKTVFWDMSVPSNTKLTHDPAGTVEPPQV